MYFWILWLLVIIVFFFTKQNLLRFVTLLTLFLIISCTNVSFTVSYFVIYINVFIAFMYALFFYAYVKGTFYTIICTFICALFYAGIRLWEKTTPVLFFIPTYLFIPLCTIILLQFLCRTYKERIATSLLSMTKGYVLYAFILFSYNVNYELGEYDLFIHLAIVIFGSIGLYSLKKIYSYFRYVIIKLKTEYLL